MSQHAWLGDREVLLHIGPPKTGTTALQQSLAEARPALRRQGVLYPGKRFSHWRASCAVMGTPATSHPADPPVDISYWDRLVEQVAHRTDRAVVSSELFADADPSQARRIIEDLGGSAVRILITVRPLALVLPSSWQQSLKSGAPKPLPGALRRVKSRVVKPYDEWLADVLAGKSESLFWRRNDYADLVRHWSQLVGVDRVAVVVVDSGDPLRILRDAESLIGLSAGTLNRVFTKTNRSLTVEEADLVRQWLVRLERDLPMEPTQYHRWIRRGALWGLVDGRERGPDEHALRTPDWALAQIDERTAQMADRIRTSGVQVVGDLSDLTVGPAPAAAPLAQNSTVPTDVAIELLMGLATMAAKDVRTGR